MARPKKATDEAREFPVAFRLTIDELAHFNSRAATAGLRRSDYGRQRLLSEPMIVAGSVTQGSSDILAVLALTNQIRRAGVVINQWVHRMHSTGVAPPAEAEDALVEIRALVKKARGLVP